MHHHPYPLDTLSVDANFSSFAMPLASFESPTVPAMSHPMDKVEALSKLVKFTDKGSVHFIKQ